MATCYSYGKELTDVVAAFSCNEIVQEWNAVVAVVKGKTLTPEEIAEDEAAAAAAAEQQQ